MQTFLSEDFLLSTDSARELYRKFAADQPIIDYHCHGSPKEIYEDKRFPTSPRSGSAATITNGV